MNQFKKVSAAVIAVSALSLAPGVSHGLGFGRPSTKAVLGERLHFSVPLRLEGGEDITSECLVADVFLGDDKLASGSVTVSIQRALAGETTLMVRTSVALNEPVVTVYLIAGCQSKVTRKFTLFVDPPGADAGVPIAAPLAVNVPGEAPVAAVVRASSPLSPRISQARMPAGTPAPSKASSPVAAARSVSVAASNGRLLLDPVEQDALLVPSLRMATALGASSAEALDSPATKERRAAAAALWRALNASPEQLARDRQRLNELEQRLAVLKQEGDKAKATVLELQSRASGLGNIGWLAGLSGLLVVALGGAAYFYYRRRGGERRSWLQAGPAPEEDMSRSGVEPESLTDLSSLTLPKNFAVELPAVSPAPSVFIPVAPPPIVLPTAAVPSGALPVMPVEALTAKDAYAQQPVASPAPFERKATSEPLRAVSVEELIDLEQQAEFFVVLGQDDAAVDLLEDHVHSTTGASPLPFLKLLEMYQRLDRRSDYERIQNAFNSRFNGYAPAWEADLQQGHSLVDYPGAVERLQAMWASPSHAMDVLEKSLTRADQEGETFDLPAYRELLFLYAVARDLSEREGNDRESIDLLLPVDDFGQNAPVYVSGEAASSEVEVEPLMATRPIKAQPQARPSISLDLQLDDLGMPDDIQASKAASPFVSEGLPGSATTGPIDFEHSEFGKKPVIVVKPSRF